MTHDGRYSPSAVARAGLGLPPASGASRTSASTCMACGTAIPAGDTVVEWAPSHSTFTDWQYLVRDGYRGSSGGVCRDCAPLLKNRVMQRTQKCVISRDDAWSLAKDANRAWFLRTPPKPPFVAVISDAMKQHLLWRAAVTIDSDLIFVQLGRSTLRIDRPRLFEAEACCIRAAEIASTLGVAVHARHPFLALDRERSDPGHGVLNPTIVTASAHSVELADRLDALLQLGEGELWALSALVKVKIEVPLAEPLTL
ncbi:type IV CRISPR-associated protein Csf1 [Thiohalocapsa marina]|uniref:type IV CRISPR-associated protein Csf1 n=1 Tax=Thiohalocapsa marina TaxID=424902 RepID=UPI0036DAA3E2